MREPVNRALIEQLLKDETLSYKEIARQAGCSDWSVRALARERTGAPPMKTSRAQRYANAAYEPDKDSELRPLTTTEQVIAWSVAAVVLIALALAWKGRRFDDYPPDGSMP